MLASLAPRSDFPLLAANPGLHYLDSAATAQKPAAVLDAIRGFYETANANPHRGAYALSAKATDLYQDARATIARFVGVADSDCVIFTRGTTEAMNLVASSWGRANVRAGDEIVVTALEHHANFVPWQQLALATGATLRIVELTAQQTIDLDQLREAVNTRTKLVAITHVSNAVGAITPLDEAVHIIRARSAAVIVVDGAQAVPHLSVNFDALDIDFYAFSGHKLLGPMGIGCLVGRRTLLEKMPPYQFGGDMIEWVRDTESTWNVLPHKFEAGTPHIAGGIGLGAALDYLTALDPDAVAAHERDVLAYGTAQLAAVPGLRLVGTAAHKVGVLSFLMEGAHPSDVGTILDQVGVAVRTGHHCTQPLMDRFGVPATARASMALYSTRADIDALVRGLHLVREMFA